MSHPVGNETGMGFGKGGVVDGPVSPTSHLVQKPACLPGSEAIGRRGLLVGREQGCRDDLKKNK